MSDNTNPDPTTDAAPEADAPEEKAPKLFDEAYVKSLRDEAAAARVAKKDAVEAAEKALNEKHQAELAERDTAHTELQNELAQAQLELEKYRTAISAKVPSEKVQAFVDILKGEDAESLKASAQAALDLVGGFEAPRSPAFDPSQGRGGKDPLPLNGDPILEAIKQAVGINK